jgi:hypothetical protein
MVFRRFIRLNMAGKTFTLLLFIFCMYPCSAKENEYLLSSPSRKTSVYFWVSDNKNACYRVEFAGTAVLGESKLGIIREDGDFSSNLTLESVSDVETVKAD